MLYVRDNELIAAYWSLLPTQYKTINYHDFGDIITDMVDNEDVLDYDPDSKMFRIDHIKDIQMIIERLPA